MSEIADPRVDCCIFCIQPHRLRPVDLRQATPSLTVRRGVSVVRGRVELWSRCMPGSSMPLCGLRASELECSSPACDAHLELS